MPVKDPNLTQDIARERARVRAKKHYEAHKDAILAKRKNKRLGLNADDGDMIQNENNDPNYENNDGDYNDDYNEARDLAPPGAVAPALAVVLKKRRGRPKAQVQAVPAPQAVARAQPAPNRPRIWDVPAMKIAIKQGVTDGDYAVKTGSTYISSLNRLAKIIDLTGGIEKHMKTESSAKKVVALLKKRVNDTNENVNTARGTIQFMLKFADMIGKFDISPASRIIFKDWFDLVGLKSSVRSAEKREEVLEATWPEYLARVDQKYGQNRASKSWLLGHMYGDSPDNGGLRDDLKNVIVASRMPPADSKENVLVVPRAGAVYLHVGSHKSKNKIGARKATYAPYLSDRIREYIDKNNIQIGEPIFGKGPLSTFIGNLSESLGYKTRGIGFYRRMWGTDPDATPEQIIEHARILGHSTRAHIQSYQRRRA